MAPSPKSLDYRHPWWLRVAVAGGAACVSAYVLIAANVFPRWPFQVHGWPLTYMVRLGMDRSNGFSEYYGPWPILDAPLLEFRPVCLAVDVLLGIALILLAGYFADCWLRSRRTPLQFGVRALLVSTTAMSCASALLVLHSQPGWALLWIFLMTPRFIVSLLFCLLVISAVHWMVRGPAVVWRSRRSGRLHVLTWIAAAAFAVPFLYHCFLADSGYVRVNGTHVSNSYALSAKGWPFKYTADSPPYWADRAGLPDSYTNIWALIADVALSASLIAAAICVVEWGIRRSEKGQPAFRWLWLGVLVALAPAVWSMIRGGPPVHPDWYTLPFWLFAISCAALFAVMLSIRRGAPSGGG